MAHGTISCNSLMPNASTAASVRRSANRVRKGRRLCHQAKLVSTTRQEDTNNPYSLTMDDPIQRYRTKSRDRHRQERKSLRSIEQLQNEVYKTKQTISSATDNHKGEMNLSQHSRGRLSRRRVDNAKIQSRSKSRSYQACPFDADGYCILHPDVRLAKMKVGGWKVVQKCHKCLCRTNSPSTTVSLTDSYQEESNRRHEKQSKTNDHRRCSSRGRRRETHDRDEHKSNKQQSRSKSSRSRSKSLRRSVKKLTPKRTVCVNGAPFDKNGRCFVHNHIKLASKKLLGGWKVHFRFCPECAEDDVADSNSVFSDISGLSKGSFTCGYDDRSVASSANLRGDASVRSSRSYKSVGSQRTWSSKQSKKRIDDSFLPLDKDGYCLHHPDVQLAEISRKGGWNVLFDFCPGERMRKSNVLVSLVNQFTHNLRICSFHLYNRMRGGNSYHWRTATNAAEVVALFKPFFSRIICQIWEID